MTGGNTSGTQGLPNTSTARSDAGGLGVTLLLVLLTVASRRTVRTIA